MKEKQKFYFSEEIEVTDSKNLIWQFITPEHDETIAQLKIKGETAELLSFRLSSFFNFIVGVVPTEYSIKVFTQWLNKYYSEKDIAVKIEELREELFTSYGNHITKMLADKQSKNEVLLDLESIHKFFDQLLRIFMSQMIHGCSKTKHWSLITDSILSINNKIVSDLLLIGKDFEGFRGNLLQLDYKRRDVHIFLDQLMDPQISLSHKFDRLENVARMLWPYMQHREDYLKLHEILKINAKAFKNSPDYVPIVNSLNSILEYGNNSEFKYIKFLINYYYNYVLDGKKLFHLESSENSVVLNAKNDLLQFIYNPKEYNEPKFILEGPTDLTHSFIHDFFTNPSIKKASNDKITLSAIDDYKAFYTRQRKIITTYAVTRHMQRMRDQNDPIK